MCGSEGKGTLGEHDTHPLLLIVSRLLFVSCLCECVGVLSLFLPYVFPFHRRVASLLSSLFIFCAYKCFFLASHTLVSSVCYLVMGVLPFPLLTLPFVCSLFLLPCFTLHGTLLADGFNVHQQVLPLTVEQVYSVALLNGLEQLMQHPARTPDCHGDTPIPHLFITPNRSASSEQLYIPLGSSDHNLI